ncbi:MAG: glycerophosphoryl diester phosphodiesterase [Solirubrobacteraceae bacterium]|jgi:glycerophosphoryl diester phosphodiesterase|nr:glycerophosphoryl diester phosphodiesterase [Solirubrobacteraceae bacterium]
MTAALLRVGHKGADGIVAGNTPASFDAALAAGVEMIEFDVLSAKVDGSGELLVAHDYTGVAGAPTLGQALGHLQTEPFGDVLFDVDLKLPGYELRTVEALREAGLLERALISSMYASSLALIRAADPVVRLGLSVPRVRRDYTADPRTRLLAVGLGLAYRAALPRWAARAIAAGRFDAIMSHWRLVSPALVAAIAAAGGELYVWTVDDAPEIGRLRRLGVTGVITNDPRLFALA